MKKLEGVLITIAVLAVSPTTLLAGDFGFVVIGDTRPRFESESFKPFESLISKINAAKPALVVNLGDLIYGYGPASKEKQWEKYEAVAKAIHGPYYQVPVRLGFNAAVTEAKDRTPGHKPGVAIQGAKCVTGPVGGQTCYEIAIPWHLFENFKPRSGSRIMLDISYLMAEPESEPGGGPEPAPNTFSYRVRYGIDSLVPVHFLELNLESNR